MTPEQTNAWARKNGLRPAVSPFALHQLAEMLPSGATAVRWPCSECSTSFVDRDGRPAAIIVQPHAHDGEIRELADLVRWLKLEAYAAPNDRFATAEPGGRHFIVVTRPGFGEPRWLRLQMLQ